MTSMESIVAEFEAIRNESVAARHTGSSVDPYRVTAAIERQYNLDDRLRAVLMFASALRYLQKDDERHGFVSYIQAATILRDGIKNAIDGRSTGLEWMTIRHRYNNNRDGPQPPNPAPHDRRCADCGSICPTGFTKCWDHRDPLAAPAQAEGTPE